MTSPVNGVVGTDDNTEEGAELVRLGSSAVLPHGSSERVQKAAVTDAHSRCSRAGDSTGTSNLSAN